MVTILTDKGENLFVETNLLTAITGSTCEMAETAQKTKHGENYLDSMPIGIASIVKDKDIQTKKVVSKFKISFRFDGNKSKGDLTTFHQVLQTPLQLYTAVKQLTELIILSSKETVSANDMLEILPKLTKNLIENVNTKILDTDAIKIIFNIIKNKYSELDSKNINDSNDFKDIISFLKDRLLNEDNLFENFNDKDALKLHNFLKPKNSLVPGLETISKMIKKMSLAETNSISFLQRFNNKYSSAFDYSEGGGKEGAISIRLVLSSPEQFNEAEYRELTDAVFNDMNQAYDIIAQLMNTLKPKSILSAFNQTNIIDSAA